MKTWIVRHANGALTQHCTRGTSLEAEGISTGLERAMTPRTGTATERWDWSAGKWIDDLPALEADLLFRIDQTRATRMRAVILTNDTSTLAYARKGEEARDYAAYPPEALEVLSSEAKEARWPWLTTLAELSAKTLEQAVASVLIGMEASEGEMRQIDGAAVAAKEALRNADTAEEKRNIAASYLNQGG